MCGTVNPTGPRSGAPLELVAGPRGRGLHVWWSDQLTVKTARIPMP